MFATIIIGLLLIAAIALFVLGRRTKRSAVTRAEAHNAGDRESRSYNWTEARPKAFAENGFGYLPPSLALVPLVIALFIGFMASTTIVQAKQQGVLTTFGAPADRTLDPGLNVHFPWQDVTHIDATIITNEYRDDAKGTECGGAIYVRIGDGSRSCLTTTIRWRIDPSKANVIYADYRSDDPTESFRKAVISTQFKSAAQAVMSAYNPIATLEVVEGNNAEAASELNFAPDYDQVALDLEEQMTERLGDDPLAFIESITVSYVSLSESTQRTLDDFIKAVGETRIAAQNVNTADQQADANEKIRDSLKDNPGALQSRCIDFLFQAAEAGYELPAGGVNCLGAGSSVVIPAAKP